MIHNEVKKKSIRSWINSFQELQNISPALGLQPDLPICRSCDRDKRTSSAFFQVIATSSLRNHFVLKVEAFFSK